MNTKKNIVSKAVSVLICLAICIGCFSAMLTVSATPASLTTNGNGGATDVGAWFTTYNTSAFWGSNGRFSNPELAQVGFKALKSDGTYGIPNSGSVSEIDFQIRKMAEAGIDFILFDLTNGGLSSEINYGNDASLAFIVNNAKLTCERISAWNDTHTWKIRYAVAVGIYDALRKSYTGSLSGSPYTHTIDSSTAATIGLAAELQAEAVYEQFVSNATYGDDYYEIDGNPLLVLHDTSGRSGSEKVAKYENLGGTTTYISDFSVRDSVSRAGAGNYGWYTNGSTSDNNDCGTVADDEVMLVCPGHWNHDSNTPNAYRENGAHYEANWDAVLANTPRIVMIAALNDYMEDEAIWPTDTRSCTVEEKWSNPYQYWNMTVDYINQLRTANGDTVPSAAERSGNVAFGATVTANSELNDYPVSRLTDGIIDYDRTTSTTGITNYASSGIGYFEITLDSAADINQVKVIRTTWEASSFPKDIAIDVQNASGSWKRVAEKHEIPSNVPHALVFNFATVTNATKIRVSANKARNSSGNFRVAEIEAYLDSTVTSADYTGVAKDGTYDIPEISNGNLLLGKIASYTPGRAIEANKPLSNLTDGKYLYRSNQANCTYTSVAYGQYNSDTLEAHSAYFEYSFDDAVRLNSFKLYPCDAEQGKPRPRDIAIDVQLEDGTWQRVAADYNIIYDWNNDELGTGGEYYEDSPFTLLYLQYKFAPVDCVKIRITSNRKRMRINKGLTGSTCVFRLAEIQAFYDPSITTYSGVERPDQSDYAVPTPGLVNYAAGATATAKGNATGISNLTNGDKTERAFAYYYQETSTPTAAQCINYVDIDFGGLKTIDRVDLVYSKFADDDRGHREQDVAVDIITEDGRYVRVAEKHNFTAATTAANGSNYTLKMFFDSAEAKGIRISGNCTQTTRYTAGTYSSIFQCYAEVEAYNDPNVISNTGIETATVEGTEIPLYRAANMAFGGTVTSSNTNSSLATSYPVSRLTDGNTRIDAGCAIINYVDHFAYYDIVLDGQKMMNQIVLYLSQYEKEYLPVDLAAYAYVSGAWKRVAEQHNVSYDGITKLTFNFAEVTTTKIRVRATNKTNSSSNNFRLVEIGAFYDPNITSESYSAVVYSDVNEDFEINADDLSTLVNALLGIQSGYEIDVNEDTYSDIRDLISLKKTLANLENQE